MSDPDQRVEKLKLPVEIERDSGVSTGFVFLMPQSRLSDMMNDSRQFLPFETHSGKFSAISKATILSITPLDETQKERRYEGDDPYRILGVAEDAALEDIRQAYLGLCAEHHPDRIKGMGLSTEYVELANTHMARVNDAFQRINDQRGTNGHANGSAHGFDRNEDDARETARHAREKEEEASRQAAEDEAARKGAEDETARKAAEEETARKAEERLARLAEEEAAHEAEVIEAARRAAEEKTARLIAEEAERQAAEEESKRSSKENDIAQRAESAVLRAQAEIARKVEERAARMAQENKPAHAPKSAPKSAADSLRRAAHDLAREKEKKAG